MARMTFAHWLDLVDHHLIWEYGIVHLDFVDCPWRDMYDDEVPPRVAALEALNDEFGI